MLLTGIIALELNSSSGTNSRDTVSTRTSHQLIVYLHLLFFMRPMTVCFPLLTICKVLGELLKGYTWPFPLAVQQSVKTYSSFYCPYCLLFIRIQASRCSLGLGVVLLCFGLVFVVSFCLFACFLLSLPYITYIYIKIFILTSHWPDILENQMSLHSRSLHMLHIPQMLTEIITKGNQTEIHLTLL